MLEKVQSRLRQEFLFFKNLNNNSTLQVGKKKIFLFVIREVGISIEHMISQYRAAAEKSSSRFKVLLDYICIFQQTKLTKM